MKKTSSRAAPATRSSAPALACALALAAAVGCAGPRAEEAAAPFVVPDYHPLSVVLETPAGAHLDVADYRGRAVLVLAFTTDNLLCQAQLHELERLARAHGEDVAVIAVAGDDTPARALATILQTYADVVGLPHVVLTLASDDVRAGTSALGRIERVPTLFFVNRAGVIVRRVESYLSQAQLEALVGPALPPRS